MSSLMAIRIMALPAAKGRRPEVAGDLAPIRPEQDPRWSIVGRMSPHESDATGRQFSCGCAAIEARIALGFARQPATPRGVSDRTSTVKLAIARTPPGWTTKT